ncbi:MAG: hypothetical protein ACI4VH_01750 [Clostridia bacterium]
MEKKLKRKCVISILMIILGIIITTLSLKINNLTELQQSYMNGFGISLTVVSIVLLIKNGLSLRNPKELRKREIELTDERLKEISTKSMAITFRIFIIIEAFISIILAFTNNEIGIYMGLIVGLQLIIFCITNVIISKKI